MTEPHWFADPDDEVEPPNWAPFLETGEGHIPRLGVWFETKRACEEWIDKYLVGTGRESSP